MSELYTHFVKCRHSGDNGLLPGWLGMTWKSEKEQDMWALNSYMNPGKK